MRFRLTFQIALIGLLLSACNFSLAADITPPPNYVPPSPVPTLGPLYAAEAPDVQNGQSIYIEKCMPCHGETGLGDGAQGKQLPVPVAALGLADTARPASPARWFTVVSQGNIDRYMPPFTSLSEQERWDVVNFALSMHTTPSILQQGRDLFASKCAGCPVSFFSNQEKMAALSEDDLAKLIREGGEGVTALGTDMSDDQVYAVAGYLRSLSFAAPSPVAAASPSVTGTPYVAESGTPAAGSTPLSGTPLAEAEGGIVNGTAVSKSGTAIPSGLPVTLRGFDHAADQSGPKETMTLEGTLGPDGAFQFKNVDLPEGRILLAELEYQGITYQSQFKTLQAGEKEVSLDPITVYESSQDYSSLSVDQLHVAFDFGTGETLQVFEIFSFSNKTDQAIMIKSDGSQIPFIQIPEGATDVGFEAGQNSASFSSTKDGIALLPSETPYSLIAFFSLPYNSNGTSITQPMLLQTDSVSVFAPEGIKLKSDKLSDAGVQNISGSNFHMYSATGLSANSQLAFSLSGKPDLTSNTADQSGSSRQTIIYGAGALGLALIGLGVWMYLRDRNARPAPDQTADEEEDEFEDPDSVMDAIIALDDLHRAKKIPDIAYQQRRAELKEQLKKLESKG
jgi:mono/diheme cytochrome c family protein